MDTPSLVPYAPHPRTPGDPTEAETRAEENERIARRIRDGISADLDGRARGLRAALAEVEDEILEFLTAPAMDPRSVSPCGLHLSPRPVLSCEWCERFGIVT